MPSISGFVRRFDFIGGLAALVLGAAAFSAAAEPPLRVVSINLCTDQLALTLAAPGQLISVSRLAQDAGSSPLYEVAQGFETNGSGAEEVFLLQPDLVLAGTFTAPATVRMLRSLGLRVEQFAPADSLADIPDSMARIGALLGREAAADAAIADFRRQLDRLSTPPQERPRAALYYVNSYTSGTNSLAGDILTAAGFQNIADDAGLASGGALPIEQLVMLAPDVIIEGRDYPGQARAESNLSHPALSALPDTVIARGLLDSTWICGSPAVLQAVAKMRDLRLSLESGR